MGFSFAASTAPGSLGCEWCFSSNTFSFSRSVTTFPLLSVWEHSHRRHLFFNILLKKLVHYGNRGAANNCFKSYLSNRKQFVIINGVNSDLQSMKFGVPQGSVLGPLLFLIYTNDLHSTIKFWRTRHFADDTNLLIKNKSLKQLKKQLNVDLYKLVTWFKSNKISLNVRKTEMLIFRHPKIILDYDLQIKLGGKRIYPSKDVKYLGILIDLCPNMGPTS